MTLPGLSASAPWPPRARWPEALHRAVAAVRAVLEEGVGPEGDAAAGPAAPASGPAAPAFGLRALVALSGGADSLALAAACAALTGTRAGERLGPVGAVVVDHGLQEASAEVAAAAADTARRFGLAPVTVTRVEVVPAGDGPEAAARTARRAALARAARAAAGPVPGHAERGGAVTPVVAVPVPLVLTAHTAEDQAEQVLLGLARGSGTRSLAGIPPRGRLPEDVPVARPLLGLTRADTEAICRWAGLTWFEDPHNRDPALLRSRIRTRILPALEDPDAGLGPGVRAALTRTAALAAEDADALDAWAARELDRLALPAGEAGDVGAEGAGVVVALDLEGLAALPAAVRRRVIARAARRAGARNPARERVLAVDALVTDAHRGGGSAGPVELAGGVRAVREGAAGGRDRRPRRADVTRVPQASAGADARGPCARLVLIPRRRGR